MVGGNPLLVAVERNYFGGRFLESISTALLSFSVSALTNRTAYDRVTAS